MAMSSLGLAAVSVEQLTPLEALNLLHKLRQLASGTQPH